MPAARMEDAESAANAFVDIEGLTCEDGPMGTCVPYGEDGLTSDGKGGAELWKAFPRELIPAPDGRACLR